jgi:hypothetical protein
MRSKEEATPPFRRSAALAVLVAVAAIALAACDGSHSPQVARLGKTSGSGGSSGTNGSGGHSATTARTGDPTRLLNEWATCMRRHGDPGQADPTVTADKLIDINWNPAIPGGFNGTNKGGQGNSGPGQYCRAYLNAAQTALQGGSHLPSPSPHTLLKFAQCMQGNGIPDFPDPKGDSLSMNIGGDLSPANPTFRNASRLCARRTGAKFLGGGTPPPGTIELNGGGPGLSPG